MRRKLFAGLLLLACLLIQGVSEAHGRQAQTVTVWLIPLEPADEDTRADIDLFDRSVSEDGPVTVLNTRCRIYRDQLKNWNPEFDYPNFPIVKGQRQTIKALARFAKQNDVHINVRFVWWGQAFGELKNAVKAVILSCSGEVTLDKLKGLGLSETLQRIAAGWPGPAEEIEEDEEDEEDELLNQLGLPEVRRWSDLGVNDAEFILKFLKSRLHLPTNGREESDPAPYHRYKTILYLVLHPEREVKIATVRRVTGLSEGQANKVIKFLLNDGLVEVDKKGRAFRYKLAVSAVTTEQDES